MAISILRKVRLTVSSEGALLVNVSKCVFTGVSVKMHVLEARLPRFALCELLLRGLQMTLKFFHEIAHCL